MVLSVRRFRCRSDNVGMLVRNDESGETMLVDAPEEAPILREIEATGWIPSAILVTHHHSDHTEAIPSLKARFGLRVLGPAAEADRIPALDEMLTAEATLRLLGEPVHAFATPGHTRGHMSYHFPSAGIVFTGDTLFALGCGRLTECDAAAMFASLTRLRALPADSVVHCGHDYLEKNARFALTVEPDNAALQARGMEGRNLSHSGLLAPPSTIGQEVATNPFLRSGSAQIRKGLGMEHAADLQVFAELRRRRNSF